MGTTIAEHQGVVAGLVEVVKDLTTNVNHVLKRSAKWPKWFLKHRIRIIHKAFACLPCSFYLFVEILWSKTTFPNFSSDSLRRHLIFPPKQACRFWNNSVLEFGQDLCCLSLKLPKAMKEKQHKKSLTFVLKGYVQNSANPKKTSAAD